MSLGVLSNIAAIYAQNNLNQTQGSLQKTLTQLSSGSRINSGADDAAGLSIADGLHANEAALTQSAQNATNGVGLLQTADGALSQVTNLLSRAVTLATEAANGTLTTSQVSAANQEYQNILTQIGNIGSSTNFNSVGVFSNTAVNTLVSDGTSLGSTSYSQVVGALAASTVGLTAPTGVAASVSLTTPSASSGSAASTTTLTLGTPTHTVSGTLALGVGSGAIHSITLGVGTSLSQLATQINADSTYSAAGITASYSSTTHALTISGPVAAASTLTTTGTALTDTAPPAPGTAAGAGVDFTQASIAQLTAGSAQTVLTSVTTAIGDVAYQRGVIGADINQLNSASNVATVESENLTSAESNIRSTNYAQATGDLAKFKVLSEDRHRGPGAGEQRAAGCSEAVAVKQ